VRSLRPLVVAALALLAAPGVARAQIVTNGDFETGNLSGWQIFNSVPPTGNWFAYSGTASPVNGFPVNAPPQGRYAAVTDQDESGLHILYQDITLPPVGSQHQLSLIVYYTSDAPIASGGTLSPTSSPNQQFRIDVIRPEAPIDSKRGTDILRTPFATSDGDPMTLAPTQRTTYLPLPRAPRVGRTMRLRLAEVDNQDFFNASVDAVVVKSNGFTLGAPIRNKKKGTARLPVTVPGPGTLTLTGSGVVKRLSAPASKSVAVGAGTAKLVIKARGKTKRKLNRRGKAQVKVRVTYAPPGLNPYGQNTKVRLKKKI
jgi:hypothetical protein